MLELGATSSYVRILWMRPSFSLHCLNALLMIVSEACVGSTNGALLYLMAITKSSIVFVK